MTTPNWQHNSGKPPKRKLKPQALRSARERRRQLIKRLLNPSKRGVSYYYMYIHEEMNDRQQRSQRNPSKTTCY
ncbi:MAG: hypothetical protein CMA59_00455 [Euryarchaeota archaeon]|jgi:hypothetical protein|nr:hypothetical protein [Euryarchaeota archaeon]